MQPVQPAALPKARIPVKALTLLQSVQALLRPEQLAVVVVRAPTAAALLALHWQPAQLLQAQQRVVIRRPVSASRSPPVLLLPARATRQQVEEPIVAQALVPMLAQHAAARA